jgi:predicted transcriptional regulator
MREICEKYGIEDGIKASNMVTTVKRIFQTTLRQYVRNSVISNEMTVDELEEIRRFFPKKGAE